MLRKIVLGMMAVFLLAPFQNVTARERNDRPTRQRRMRPGGDGSMRAGFEKWFNDLNQAYEQNDRAKMGQLLKEMKNKRQRRNEGPPRKDAERRGPDRQRPSKASAEKKILDVLDDMFQNQRQGMMNVPPEDGRLLRLLTETTGAKRVVEIGTSNGYSGIWFCLALQKTGGKLLTHEIDAGRAALARENFKRAGVEKIITLVEGDAHKEIAKIKGPIDIVFLDADKAGYLDYLNKLLPLIRPGGLILAHNTTNAGPQMKDYIKAVTTNENLETIFLNKQDRGMGVTLKKR